MMMLNIIVFIDYYKIERYSKTSTQFEIFNEILDDLTKVIKTINRRISCYDLRAQAINMKMVEDDFESL